jgi:hypothetical protein
MSGQIRVDTLLDFPTERSMNSDRKHTVLFSETKVRFGRHYPKDDYLFLSDEDDTHRKGRNQFMGVRKRRFLEERTGPKFLNEIMNPKLLDS